MLPPRLVHLLNAAFNYDHVQHYLMDREDRFAMLRASTGDAGKQLLSIRHKLEKGSLSVIGAVTAEARPVLALDTGTVDVVHKPNPYLPHTRSEMALPLIIKGNVVGALDVQSNRSNAFSDEDVSVLTTLAAQISVAIDNARLFEQAEHRASDMSLLFAVTTAAASAESLTDALSNVANDLRDSLNALTVGIYLPVAYIDEITGNMRATMRACSPPPGGPASSEPRTSEPLRGIGSPDTSSTSRRPRRRARRSASRASGPAW
jgi:GAF domain-containing protein